MASQSADALAPRAVFGFLGRKAACLVNKVTILAGEGPCLRSAYADRVVSRTLESAWPRLYPLADLKGGDLVSVLNRVARALVRESEAFVSLLLVGLGELRPQILPAAQLDTNLNEELCGDGSNQKP
jgi:hypothetical protein